jgi:hypothetical protein
MVKLKRFITKDFFEKDVKLHRLNLFEKRGEIKVYWKFNDQLRVNLYKPKTKDQNKKALKFRVGIGVRQR